MLPSNCFAIHAVYAWSIWLLGTFILISGWGPYCASCPWKFGDPGSVGETLVHKSTAVWAQSETADPWRFLKLFMSCGPVLGSMSAVSLASSLCSTTDDAIWRCELSKSRRGLIHHLGATYMGSCYIIPQGYPDWAVCERSSTRIRDLKCHYHRMGHVLT